MEELNLKQFENIGVIADLSNWTPSDQKREEEFNEETGIEQENKEIADFIKNNPFPNNDRFLNILNRYRNV